MLTETPIAILRYLKTISHPGQCYAYLQLDQENCLIKAGGELAQFGIADINPTLTIEEQIPQLSGLLPANDKPLVIANTHVDPVQYIDMHIYRTFDSQWVIFVDSTETATKLQKQQQQRLNIAISKE